MLVERRLCTLRQRVDDTLPTSETTAAVLVYKLEQRAVCFRSHFSRCLSHLPVFGVPSSGEELYETQATKQNVSRIHLLAYYTNFALDVVVTVSNLPNLSASCLRAQC